MSGDNKLAEFLSKYSTWQIKMLLVRKKAGLLSIPGYFFVLSMYWTHLVFLFYDLLDLFVMHSLPFRSVEINFLAQDGAALALGAKSANLDDVHVPVNVLLDQEYHVYLVSQSPNPKPILGSILGFLVSYSFSIFLFLGLYSLSYKASCFQPYFAVF